MKINIKFIIATAALLFLSGCATHKSIYDWGAYEPQVYSFLKGEAPDAQIQILEKHLNEVQGKGTVPPPGFYAHLGMLYTKAGRDSDTQKMFAMEMKIYPESSAYINNINNGFKVTK
jgi:hypothetical protein